MDKPGLEYSKTVGRRCRLAPCHDAVYTQTGTSSSLNFCLRSWADGLRAHVQSFTNAIAFAASLQLEIQFIIT